MEKFEEGMICPKCHDGILKTSSKFLKCTCCGAKFKMGKEVEKYAGD